MQRFIRRFVLNFKEYIVLLLLIIISLSFLSLNDNQQIKNIKTIALGYFSFLNSSVSSVSHIFTDTDELLKLKEENARLMLQVNRLRDYGLENNELKKMLRFKDEANAELTPALIVSHLISKAQGNFIINAGWEDSVSTGMPVVDGNGLIGIVDNASENFSVVRTLHNSSLALAVIDQRSNVSGILNWDGSNLVLKNIPTTYDVKIGDRIITSEFSTIFPPSIPVGIVTAKETNISGLLNNITVKPFAAINSLRSVMVMKFVQNRQINELEINLIK